MNFFSKPWQLMMITFAGWINRQQQEIIEYLRTENQILKEANGPKRIQLNDDQRRRLAVKGKALGRQLLGEIGTAFTPDTILRWHRRLVANKQATDGRRQKIGRPPIASQVVELVVRMARENPTWGYGRIQGALANLGHDVSDQTIGNILKGHGMEPAPQRKRRTTWTTFLKAHLAVLAAIDFTTVDVWTASGLTTFYLLFAMELKSRRVQLVGCTIQPGRDWMKTCAENLTDAQGGFLRAKRYLIMDRDTKFTEEFRNTLERANVESIRLPPQSPNLNAYLERFLRSIKEECLDRMFLVGESSLRIAVSQFLEHYHAERNHQGLGNRLIEPDLSKRVLDGDVVCHERLGGLLKYYHRQAA